MDSLQVIILAAGHGKRMGASIPKVLLPLKDIPLVKRLILTVEKSEISKPPVVVVGQGAEAVKAILGDKYNYVHQTEQLGTGHAVKTTRDFIQDDAKHIMVLYGDHPIISSATINNIAKTHIENDAVITMATVKINDFDDWRKSFADYGRIVRNSNGRIEKIVEKKDASDFELSVTEVNPSYFCFKSAWLWKSLEDLTNDNAQKEYYLTALPGMAHLKNEKIVTVQIEPEEALGANTPEQLAILEKILDSRI